MHMHPRGPTQTDRQIAGLVKLWACMVCAACYVGVLLLRPWTSMPPTQCEANCTAAAVWRRSRRDPVHIRALRGPRWDAGIARDGCVGVLLSAVSRPCGQGITWRRTSTTHKTSTILNAIPLPTQRDQRAVAYVTNTTGANARPARREAWVPQQCGPWAQLSLGPMLRSIQFCSAIFSHAHLPGALRIAQVQS